MNRVELAGSELKSRLDAVGNSSALGTDTRPEMVSMIRIRAIRTHRPGRQSKSSTT